MRVLFYTTELMRLELQGADIYDLIGMYRAEQTIDFSETLLSGVHWVAHALVQVEPANEFVRLVN